MSDFDYQRVKIQSDKEGLSVSEYVRSSLLNEINDLKTPRPKNKLSEVTKPVRIDIPLNLHKKIKEDSKNTGYTIKSLIINKYFFNKTVTVNFTLEDTKKLLFEVNKIGANVNQIARKLNSLKSHQNASGLIEELNKCLSELRIKAMS
jgi:hypothetical protein